MMQIMKDSAIVIHKPERVPWEDISAVVTDSLDSRKRAKYHALPCRELSDLACHDETEDILENCLKPGGIDGAICVGDIKTVMLNVHSAYERI